MPSRMSAEISSRAVSVRSGPQSIAMGSDGDGYARLDGDFDFAADRLRQRLIVLDHAFHAEADHLLYVFQRLFTGVAPCGGG